MNIQAYEKAVSYFGTQRKLAEALDVGFMSVCHWRRRNSLPAERAIQIEQATGGHVTREDLLPEIFLAPRPVPAKGEAV